MAAGSTILVDFLARFAEREGALTERVSEGAHFVLPVELQQTLGLPEEVTCTEDPETGREKGYQFLSPGHSLLRVAAESVLARGDGGHADIALVTALPPTPADMQRRARGDIQIDHGRVDVSEAPVQTWVQVLRVGAAVTYATAIDERVDELDEVFVLGNGSPAPDSIAQRLTSVIVEPGAPPATAARTDAWSLTFGVAAADSMLRSRSDRRSLELARLTASRNRRRLEAVDDYYRRMLDSVIEREKRAPLERRPMLVQQRDATRIEWERRRAEIADELTPLVEIRPFRLHVVWVPAWDMLATVRREGPRLYPLQLTFVPLVSSFLVPVCPGCGSSATLVAGKDHLGCRSCEPGASDGTGTADDTDGDRREAYVASDAEASALQGSFAFGPSRGGSGKRERAGSDPRPVPSPPRQEGPPQTPSKEKSSKGKAKAGRESDAGSAAGRRQLPPGEGQRQSGRATPRATSGRATPRGGGGRGPASVGDRLTRLLVESAYADIPLREKDIVSGSPIDALNRLYGPRGVRHLIGLKTLERPTRFASDTEPTRPDGVVVSHAWLWTQGDRELPFVFEWRSADTRLVALDRWSLARVGGLLGGHSIFASAMRERIADDLGHPPAPIVPLEPALEGLVSYSSEYAGLGYACRCIAAWSWLTGSGAEKVEKVLAGADPPVNAAAVEVVTARRAGIRISARSVAERHGVDVDATTRQARRVQSLFDRQGLPIH